MTQPSSPTPPRTRRKRLLMLWVAALGTAAAAGSWVRHDLRARSQRDGQSAVALAAGLANAARDAEAAGDLSAAVENSREALELLRATEGARNGVSYAATLAGLASRLARQDSAEGVNAAASLLEEAWALPDLSPPLRGRIARDRGAVALLQGHPDAAQEWYERAEAEDGARSPRLDALRDSARLAGQNDR